MTNGVVSMSPSFIGIEPAEFEQDGVPMAPLRDHAAAGVALIGALPADLRDAALLGSRPRELHAGAGRDGVLPAREGSRVGEWPEERQRQLVAMVRLWVGVMPPVAAQRRLAAIAAELPEVRFAWHGPTDGSGSLYYRIQCPTLIIEFSTRGALGARGGH